MIDEVVVEWLLKSKPDPLVLLQIISELAVKLSMGDSPVRRGGVEISVSYEFSVT